MDALFLQTLNMSITASYVILAVVLIRLLLKKVPKSISYALWCVVLFRLICPFSFESVLSLLPSTNPLPPEILVSQTPMINIGIPIIDNSVTLPAPLVGDSVNPMRVWITIGMILWLTGVLVLVAYSAISYLLLKRRVGTAVLVENNIFECATIFSPFVLGLFKPKIYLPKGLQKEEKAYILKHEQFHIKRKDNIIKLFSFLVLCVHWFNPLVWISFILMTKDMEMSCDEAVLKQMGSDIKQDYSLSLLSLAVSHKIPNGSPLAFGESNIKSRITNVLNYKKPAFWVIIVAVIAVISICVALIANPKEQYSFDNPVYKDKKQPVAMTDFLLAENSVTLVNGETVKLQVVMSNGRYYDVEYAGYGGGVYEENYNGAYEFRILSNNKVVSTQKMKSYAGEEKYNFNGHFDVLFGDYNNDGNPDFSVGQWIGSTTNEHTIYTIDKNKKIKTIGLIYTSEGKYNSDFSYKFKNQNDKTIVTEFYDNGIGENRSLYFQWDEQNELFKEAIIPSAEEFIDSILSSVKVTDNVISLTIPNILPTDFTASQIHIYASGNVPTDDGITPLHPFQKEMNSSLWEVGKTYNDVILNGKIPDGTDIYISAGFSEKSNSDSVGHYKTISKVFPLRDDTTIPSVKITDDIQNKSIIFTDKFGDTLKLALTLPNGWTINESTDNYNGLPSPKVNIISNGVEIGEISTNNFKLYPQALNQDNFYVSVYGDIMLGSGASWDSEYDEIIKTDTTAVATCKPWQKIDEPGVSRAGQKDLISKGILSYDINLLKYITINLNDNAVTDAEWLSIAKSIKLSN